MSRVKWAATLCLATLVSWMEINGLPSNSGREGPSQMRDAERLPNFVVILADDLGYGDLGCFGSRENNTPHLDQLAKEGMKFTDFHSNGPMCSPTRASVLTGQYPQRFGRQFEGALSPQSHFHTGLPLDVVTIPEALKNAGYATAMFGKWHLGYQAPYLPTRQGFDEFRGLLTGDGDHHSHINRSGGKDWWRDEKIAMEEGYTAELITKHSIDFIERHKERPFFLYVAHLSIHFPWQGPGEKGHRIEGRNYWNLSKLGPHAEGNVKPVVREMIQSMDKSVGDILHAIRRWGLDEDTLVLFTSDNGGYLSYEGRFNGEISNNGPLRGQKGDVFEGGHRVAAIARWPGRIQAGAVSHETVMTMDLMPTFLDLARLVPPEGLDGRSFLPVLLEREQMPDRFLFWRKGEEWAVRRGAWKLVGSKAGSIALYNLETDLGEATDRASERPEIVGELLRALGEWEQAVDANEPG